jgi:hypothetical protein
MGINIKVLNVLAYEPQGMSAGLKIAKAVIDDIAFMFNVRLADLLRPELNALSLIPPAASPYDCAARAADLPAAVSAKLGIPEEQQLMINLRPYDRLGHLPGVLGEFADVYQELVPGGIAVTLLNTACSSAAPDFVRLAELLDQFPAMRDSTWIVTNSLRESVPKAFMAKITERRGGRPGGKAGKHLAVVEGLPHLVPIGDSIVMVAKKECQEVVLDRLKHLRKWNGRA